MSSAAETPAAGNSSVLSERIREEIATAGGAIPFHRFMERALYEPGLGYYERDPGNVGRAGDFYTSVSVGPLFGELLAFHLASRLARLAEDGPVSIVEVGAHGGQLAADLLDALDRLAPSLAPRIGYQVVEPSETRRTWQARALERFGERVQWQTTLPGNVRGVILSNELLDAFPLRRGRWRKASRRWAEQGVRWTGTRFDWVDLPGPAPVEWALPEALAEVLPEGFAHEDCPGAENWWRLAAGSLREGILLTCDYGHATDGLPDPNRPEGSLRGYRRHRHVEDLLESPGEVDLTAHVDFSRIRQAGEAAGLTTVMDGTQAVFLTEIFRETLNAPERFGVWTPARVRSFQTLTHPQHLGRAFRTLVQERRT